jgi:hypothetical protein
MNRKTPLVFVFAMFVIASLSCTNPITRYFSTQTAVMETATATMWTPTPTNTPTSTPTPTPTQTPTSTLTPTPDNRFYEKGGGIEYSYIPPTGWRKSAGATGLTQWEGEGTTVLSFNVQESSQDAAWAAATMEDALKAGLTSFVVTEEDVFSPESGLDAYRFAFTAKYQGIAVFGEMFVFSGSGYLVEALYLRPDGSDEAEDALVIESMMTMRFEG